jgi:general L-amino acid transport system permease protein
MGDHGAAVSKAEASRAPGPMGRLLAILNDRKGRAIAIQVLTTVLLLAVVWFFVANTMENLKRQNIASGFGFLGVQSGLDVLMHLIPYGPQSTYARLLLVGVLNTLLVSALGIVFATMLGLAIGLARLSRNVALSGLAQAFIEFVRNIPLLLFVFFWYFGIVGLFPEPRASITLFDAFFLNKRGLFVPAPESWIGLWRVAAALALAALAAKLIALWAARRQAATGRPFPTASLSALLLIVLPALAFIHWVAATAWDVPQGGRFNIRGGFVLIPEFVALFAALTTYTAGFIAEVVRAGIQSVSRGQREAALALGLKPGQVMRLIVLPQALRVIVPPLTSQYLNLIKNSSFGAAIAMPELVQVFMGSTLNQTGQAVEVVAITLAIYLTVNLAVSAFINWYNKKVALVTR